MTQRSLVQTTADAFDGYLTAWSQTDFSQSVMGLATPFQILLGQYDPAVTKGLMEQTLIKWFTHTQLTMIENAGHYPMVESPVYLVTLWENFLQEMVQKRSEGSAVLTH
jgi:pimeloyl-ACP methyl ester carboxylesterase